MTAGYDPFAAGPAAVGVRTIEARDRVRGRDFPCEIWYPAEVPGGAAAGEVEGEHEALRAMSMPGEAAWIPAPMRPVSELCSSQQAHEFTRGLTLAHLDAALRGRDTASRLLGGDMEAALAAPGWTRSR